jgi:anti-sigma28 factor (negative regulator of flagellin synthesis)
MESRVLALREAVNNGQYGLEPNEIADAMLSDGV